MTVRNAVIITVLSLALWAVVIRTTWWWLHFLFR